VVVGRAAEAGRSGGRLGRPGIGLVLAEHEVVDAAVAGLHRGVLRERAARGRRGRRCGRGAAAR
jgi:hypothetical protein